MIKFTIIGDKFVILENDCTLTQILLNYNVFLSIYGWKHPVIYNDCSLHLFYVDIKRGFAGSIPIPEKIKQDFIESCKSSPYYIANFKRIEMK